MHKPRRIEGKWNNHVYAFEIVLASVFNQTLGTWTSWHMRVFANRVEHHGERPKERLIGSMTLKVSLTRQPEIARIEITVAPEQIKRISMSVTSIEHKIERDIVPTIADDLARVMQEMEHEWSL